MDTNNVLRAASAGNLTGDETLTDHALTAMNKEMFLHTIVPSVSTDDVFTVEVTFQDASDNTLLYVTGPSISAAGHQAVDLFCNHPDLDHISVTLNTTATGTEAMSFGAVVVYLSPVRTS